MLNSRHGLSFSSYSELHDWSIRAPEDFWSAVYEFCGILDQQRGDAVLEQPDAMPGARWFDDTALNYAQNLFRQRDEATCVIAANERGKRSERSAKALYDEVSRIGQGLDAMGLRAGDVIAACLPNIIETLAVFMAASSRGLLWASCSPDFGLDAMVDRFGPLHPKCLVGIDRYSYGGKDFDCIPKIQALQKRIASIEHVIWVPYDGLNNPGTPPEDERNVLYPRWIASFQPAPIPFATLPFNHPLYVLFSSGTTGPPKGIVHGAGGSLLQHLKEHQLHCDIQPGHRVFYFTTCGWMMWNWLVSALASEACLVLYDGSPAYPTPTALFDLIDELGIHVFGISAKYLDMLRAERLTPRKTHSLSGLRSILSTGSPLSPESFDFVYDEIKTDVHLASVSGGTDIVSCFVLGNPNAPVRRGAIQCKGLGMDVAVFSSEGQPMIDHAGELVCRRPFPSMPVGFWNDDDADRYQQSYFQRYPGVWHHGDFATEHADGSFVIHGRSDTTLNPGGVRIGTAELYRQVEKIEEVAEAVAIGQPIQGDERIILFVQLRAGYTLDGDLQQRITGRIRNGCSPRHIPHRIVQVTDIPRTKSGKISEKAVRAAVCGDPIGNLDALSNPESLEQYRNRPELED